MVSSCFLPFQTVVGRLGWSAREYTLMRCVARLYHAFPSLVLPLIPWRRAAAFVCPRSRLKGRRARAARLIPPSRSFDSPGEFFESCVGREVAETETKRRKCVGRSDGRGVHTTVHNTRENCVPREVMRTKPKRRTTRHVSDILRTWQLTGRSRTGDSDGNEKERDCIRFAAPPCKTPSDIFKSYFDTPTV